MRPGRLLPLLLVLASCAGSALRHPAEPEPVETAQVDLDSLVEGFRGGDPAAEIRLAAQGEPGLARVRPFLLSENRDLKLRSLSMLLSAGEDILLTDRERVDLVLFDLTREAPQPWASLRALGRLRGMGERARPSLDEAAAGEGLRAETAQRLLRRGEP